MSLTLYLHPLSSYCHKSLIAFYENSVAFTPQVVDLGDPVSREAFSKVWKVAKFPVLRDEARNRTIPESSMIIEYLGQYYPGPVQLIPADPAQALQVRMTDRFYDLHVHQHMQKIVADKLRPAGSQDPVGVAHARESLRTALGVADSEMADRKWAAGNDFSMADCAAAPPLFFINRMSPLAADFPNLSRYLDRLTKRPSYARALSEAAPYLSMFPG